MAIPETEYRYIGDYARDVEGQMLSPGDFVKFDKTKAEDITNEMVGAGLLVEVRQPTAADKAALQTADNTEGGEK